MLYFFIALRYCVNTLRLRRNGRHFPDDIFRYNFLNENVWIALEISLQFRLKVPVNNISALVQIMAWCWPGDKPLSEPMMDSLLTHVLPHISVTQPQWVNTIGPRQDCQHFADILKYIFFKEEVWVSVEISLKFFHKGPIANNPAQILIRAWCQTGDKPFTGSNDDLACWNICASISRNVYFSFIYMKELSLP